MEIFYTFSFSASHRLPKVPETHPCYNTHGHNFSCAVWCKGEVDPLTGWLFDFQRIKDAILPLRVMLDHHHLNDIDGLANPTSERLAQWVGERLTLPGLSKVVVQETPQTGAVWRPR